MKNNHTLIYENILGIILEKSPGVLYKVFWNNSIYIFYKEDNKKWLKYDCASIINLDSDVVDYTNGLFFKEYNNFIRKSILVSHPKDIEWLKEYDSVDRFIKFEIKKL